jgi:hypothetical protein
VLVKFRQTVRNIGCLINPMAALIDRATLPRPITRRMRQRAFVILNPCQIAGTIRRTCRSGNSSRPRRAAVHRHARPSSSRAVSAHPSSRSRSCAPLKKISPGFPRPILYGARRTSGHAAIVVLYRHGDRRCQTCRPSRSPCPCVLPGRVRTCPCRL